MFFKKESMRSIGRVCVKDAVQLPVLWQKRWVQFPQIHNPYLRTPTVYSIVFRYFFQTSKQSISSTGTFQLMTFAIGYALKFCLKTKKLVHSTGKALGSSIIAKTFFTPLTHSEIGAAIYGDKKYCSQWWKSKTQNQWRKYPTSWTAFSYRLHCQYICMIQPIISFYYGGTSHFAGVSIFVSQQAAKFPSIVYDCKSVSQSIPPTCNSSLCTVSPPTYCIFW